METILKLYVFGVNFFSYSWNNFDFTIVALSLIGVLIEELGIIDNFDSTTIVIRTFRIVRVLRIIR